jgi:glycine/D-amino acid oxidase-like deaminating enzyme/nitrite reductase/ring-hydroxylating ferredoxin subunit
VVKKEKLNFLIMTKSIWEAIAAKQHYPQPGKNLTTEVLVIGGGITGVSTAYRLQSAGHKVCLVEARQLGSGVSGKTTAHLTTSVDARYSDIASSISKEAAALLAKGAREAIELVGETDRQENLESRFRRLPAYQYATDDKQLKQLEQEFEAARTAGLSVEKVKQAPDLPFQTQTAIMYPDNAAFNPLIYIHKLAEKFVERGGELYENTLIGQIEDKDGQVTASTAGGYEIKAKYAVMATHSPLGIDPVQTMLPPYRSYALAFATHKQAPEALYYDYDEPYHYIRPALYDGREVWVVGGADHKTGSGDEQAAEQRLKQYVGQHFEVSQYLHSWSAQVFEPVDNLPFIGKSLIHDHIYIATGFSGDGTLWGSLSAKILTDLISQQPNEYAKLFSPSRANIKGSAGEFVKANAEVGWHFMADRFSHDTREVQDIQPGEGKILQQGTDQYAVYRDPDGKVHAMSSTCVHLKCKVNWNNLEKTWDCPCHGGRYQATGEVLEGPPHHSLKSKDL